VLTIDNDSFGLQFFGKPTCCRFPPIPLSQGFTGDFLESKNDQMMRCHRRCTPHSCAVRTRGDPPHATALGERPMSWQNPVSCVSDRGRLRSVEQNPKRLGGFAAKLCVRPNLYTQTPHRSGRASSSRGFCGPFLLRCSVMPHLWRGLPCGLSWWSSPTLTLRRRKPTASVRPGSARYEAIVLVASASDGVLRERRGLNAEFLLVPA
jgi:hypothetical protein